MRVIMDWEHINAIFWMSIFGIAAGVFITRDSVYFVVLGFLFILFDVYLEYYFLKKMDTRKEVKKTKEELQKYVEEARKLKIELEKSVVEITEIKKNVFDVFSKKGFKTVEERLKDLEEKVEGKFGRNGLDNLKDDMEKVKGKLNIY